MPHRPPNPQRTEIAIKCIYCKQDITFFTSIPVQDLVQGDHGKTNLGSMEVNCSLCSQSMLVRLFCSLSTEIWIRKIDPPNLTLVDNGEYITTEEGWMLPAKTKPEDEFEEE